MIDSSFANIRPAPVPRSHAFPFNDDIQYNFTVLYDDVIVEMPEENNHLETHTGNHPDADRKVSNSSITSVARRCAYNEKVFCKFVRYLYIWPKACYS